MKKAAQMTSAANPWIMDWNQVAPPSAPGTRIAIHDETLRDGLQSPSAVQPSLGAKLDLLHRMADVGVESADLGMPASGPRVKRDVLRLAAEIASAALPVAAVCAARTTPADIAAVCDVAQRASLPVQVMTFVGISPIRMYAEHWRPGAVVRRVRDAVSLGVREGLDVCLVTEDTTRATLSMAVDVYAAALEEGAGRICVCDTVGYATPWGAAALVARLREALASRGFPDVAMDWHGHNDRGLAVASALAAAQAGADRLHGTALGVGERAGNAPVEQLLVNLCELGWRGGPLGALPRYCEAAARACQLEIAGGQPFIGADVFRTAAGVHAAAIRKAQQRGGRWLAERVYSWIPASRVGRRQDIAVGPGSGRANARCWLQAHGLAEHEPVVQAIQQAASGADRILTNAELQVIAHDSGDQLGEFGQVLQAL
jgi:isopropylmalate/homocitrate/citramalate synthase